MIFTACHSQPIRIVTSVGVDVFQQILFANVVDTELPSSHAQNRRRGRMGGQIRIRVRFQDVATPWFDYMFLSEQELLSVLEGTGWTLLRKLDGERTYVAIIEKA